MTRWEPRVGRRRAIARPTRWAAPVTMATFPLSSMNEGPLPEMTSTAKEVRDEEPQVGRALGQPTNGVRIPLGAEWDVDADRVALGRQGFLEVPTNAVEHLELEGGFGQAGPLRVRFGRLDTGGIVGSHRHDRWNAAVGRDGLAAGGDGGIDDEGRQGGKTGGDIGFLRKRQMRR